MKTVKCFSKTWLFVFVATMILGGSFCFQSCQADDESFEGVSSSHEKEDGISLATRASGDCSYPTKGKPFPALNSPVSIKKGQKFFYKKRSHAGQYPDNCAMIELISGGPVIARSVYAVRHWGRTSYKVYESCEELVYGGDYKSFSAYRNLDENQDYVYYEAIAEDDAVVVCRTLSTP